MNKYLNYIKEIAPLSLGFILQPFIHNEITFTLIVISILIFSLYLKYYPGEWKLFILGLTVGFAFEVGAGLIYRLQYWENASLFGVPLWLPIFWGYGFIFIYRLGNLVVKR